MKRQGWMGCGKVKTLRTLIKAKKITQKPRSRRSFFPADIRNGHLPIINQKTLSTELNISESWLIKSTTSERICDPDVQARHKIHGAMVNEQIAIIERYIVGDI
jgi:hypothetical protein